MVQMLCELMTPAEMILTKAQHPPLARWTGLTPALLPQLPWTASMLPSCGTQTCPHFCTSLCAIPLPISAYGNPICQELSQPPSATSSREPSLVPSCVPLQSTFHTLLRCRHAKLALTCLPPCVGWGLHSELRSLGHGAPCLPWWYSIYGPIWSPPPPLPSWFIPHFFKIQGSANS